MCSCAKGQALFRRNAAQHVSDLTMLQQTIPSFTDSLTKDIECIRVDGASDEGPGREEVQFYWTERHLTMTKECTIVTTRHSGRSYLNKVKLLIGSIDEEKVKLNQDTATDVYIDRVSGATFNGKKIYFTKGASDAQAIYNQSRHDPLLVVLKRSKK